MMRWFTKTVLFSATLACAACAPLPRATQSAGAPGDNGWNSSTLGDGGVSDFYRYDDPILTEPGVVLRQEPLEEHQSIEEAARNIRLLYSSTDGLDGETRLAVSGVLFIPSGTPPEGGWPLMAWTHGTVGIADICSPSWNGRQQQDVDYLGFWLDQGFAVVASDYQGLGTPGTHPYLATRPAAYSNLDIIRAVQSADFPVSDRVVLIGQSQGAGAAIATASYAASYAPEIEIGGVVATGVPYFSPEGLVAIGEARPRDRPDPMLSYNFLAMTLVEQIDPNFVMSDYISEEVWPVARQVQNSCHRDVRGRLMEAGVTYNQTFRRSPSAALIAAFERMGFPDMQFGAPVFLGTGALDRDTPARMQASFARNACAAGSTIEAHLYPDLDHRGVVLGSRPDSLPFVQAAFAGDEISGNCDNLPFR
ncbi:MAG: alpha/beta hydrolase [Parasphingopyxis sp.]